MRKSPGTTDEVQRTVLKVACEIDPKTLSRVLKYLAAEKIVRREVLNTQPFAVRAALRDKGEQVRPIMQSLKAWGEIWVLPQLSARPSTKHITVA
jgi:DNA-binding HxlR family transcriptional regulator